MSKADWKGNEDEMGTFKIVLDNVINTVKNNDQTMTIADFICELYKWENKSGIVRNADEDTLEKMSARSYDNYIAMLKTVEYYDTTLKGYKNSDIAEYATNKAHLGIAFEEMEEPVITTTAISSTTTTTIKTTVKTTVKTTAKTTAKTTDKPKNTTQIFIPQGDPYLSKGSLNMIVGDILRLRVYNYIGNIKWVSNKEYVATVDEYGNVKAVGKGTAIINVILENTTLICSVTVDSLTMIKGDANGDSKLNVRDAAYIAKMLAKGKGDSLPKIADYNGDGKVNVRDAAAIALMLSKGSTPSTPYTPSAPSDNISFNYLAGNYTYSSGAGAWRTNLTLRSDGSFEGEFSDSDMGGTGNGYPNGTVYKCDFKGKFSNLEKVNSYTYKMTLSDLTNSREEGYQVIEFGERIIYTAKASGFAKGNDFYIYTKGAPVSELPPMFGVAGSALSTDIIYNAEEKANFMKGKDSNQHRNG